MNKYIQLLSLLLLFSNYCLNGAVISNLSDNESDNEISIEDIIDVEHSVNIPSDLILEKRGNLIQLKNPYSNIRINISDDLYKSMALNTWAQNLLNNKSALTNSIVFRIRAHNYQKVRELIQLKETIYDFIHDIFSIHIAEANKIKGPSRIQLPLRTTGKEIIFYPKDLLVLDYFDCIHILSKKISEYIVYELKSINSLKDCKIDIPLNKVIEYIKETLKEINNNSIQSNLLNKDIILENFYALKGIKIAFKEDMINELNRKIAITKNLKNNQIISIIDIKELLNNIEDFKSRKIYVIPTNQDINLFSDFLHILLDENRSFLYFYKNRWINIIVNHELFNKKIYVLDPNNENLLDIEIVKIMKDKLNNTN